MGDQANYGREILKRQLLALTKNPPEGISVGLADDDDMYTWEVMICVEINQCAGCTRQFFPKSFLGDDAAVLAPSSGEEPASPRYRAGVASMAWRTTR